PGPVIRHTRFGTGVASALSASIVKAPSVALFTRIANRPGSPSRIVHETSCDQNWAYRSHRIQLRVASESGSAAKTAARPSPYCHAASNGVLLSARVTRNGTCAPLLAMVEA